MPIPAYLSRSTAVATAADPCTMIAMANLVLPATINSGDTLLFVFSASNSFSCDALGGMSGWTSVYEFGVSTSRYGGVFRKTADGTEGGTTINPTMSYGGFTAGLRFLCTCYRFEAGTIDATVGSANSGTSTTPSFASVTTNAANSNAIGFMFSNTTTTITANTGETGGDWLEVAAEDSSAGNLIQLQRADMASIGTISGGSSTLGTSRDWSTYAIALEETAAATVIPKCMNIRQAAPRAASW